MLFFAVQTFSQTFLQRRREALDLADSEWEEDASEWEDNTEENSDHRPAHEAGGGETFVSKGSVFFHKLTFKSACSCEIRKKKKVIHAQKWHL